MGLRFRKSIPIGKAFRINLSRRGVGWSASLPGSGLSFGHSPRRSSGSPSPAATAPGVGLSSLGVLLLLMAATGWAFGGRTFAAFAGVVGLMFLAAGVLISAYLATSPAAADAPRAGPVAGPGTFSTDVVGESKYQANLTRIAGRRTPDGVRLDVAAELVPEPSNPHDDQAVRVDVGGLTVGYLDRKGAREYRGRLDEAGRSCAVLTCAARILGGWDRGKGDTGQFGVKLDLPRVS